MEICVIGAVAVIVILAMSVVVFNSKGSSDNSLGKIKTEGEEEGDLLSTDAFFLRDNNSGGYALFNTDGKQLTDFIFRASKEFCNNAAVVQNKDSGEYAIIRSNGKYLVEFGKYKTIYQTGSLFSIVCHDYNDDDFIINSEGKKIFVGEDYDINECISDEYSNSQKYIYAISDDEYIYIVDYNGNTLSKIERNDDEIDAIDSNGEYGIVIYNSKAYVYDLAKNKLAFTIDGDEKYSTTHGLTVEYSKEYNVFVIKPFDNKYYVYKDGKCMFTLTSKDTNGYFSIFKDGISCRAGQSNTLYRKYDYSGNVISENENLNSSSDSNGNTIVKDSGLQYLVDKNNKKISNEYSDIRTQSRWQDKKKIEYYVGTKAGYKYLLSPEGKELVSEGAKSINVGNKYATLEYEDSVKIFDYKNNKIGLELNEKLSNINLKEYYVEVTKDGHTSYYSYTTGKKFYSN